ncbi:uncharacterized protein [Onthophagus taurus]|uniref:uncharacterized protein n=1 Tax=Onthophagus taurus TaxID=166361 RepID=UPI0039BE995F
MPKYILYINERDDGATEIEIFGSDCKVVDDAKCDVKWCEIIEMVRRREKSRHPTQEHVGGVKKEVDDGFEMAWEENENLKSPSPHSKDVAKESSDAFETTWQESDSPRSPSPRSKGEVMDDEELIAINGHDEDYARGISDLQQAWEHPHRYERVASPPTLIPLETPTSTRQAWGHSHRYERVAPPPTLIPLETPRSSRYYAPRGLEKAPQKSLSENKTMINILEKIVDLNEEMYRILEKK